MVLSFPYLLNKNLGEADPLLIGSASFFEGFKDNAINEIPPMAAHLDCDAR